MPKPRMTEESTRAGDLIASALRTLEAEAGGIAALCAAIRDGLGRDLVDAVELISRARGRLIVTGMGKSGHVARKVAATFASTGTPAFFVHPSEASHGDLATNAAMVLAKDAGLKPRDLAEKIAAELAKLPEVTKTEIAGPGFINMTLDPAVWRGALADIVREGDGYGKGAIGAGKTSLAERMRESTIVL